MTSTFKIPAVVFGTSAMGNLYNIVPYEKKLAVIEQIFKHAPRPVMFDSAGKYGAGLALEALGQCLRDLGIKPDEVIISNKLAWVRTQLEGEEPTFEPGVWKGLKYDAIQKISYDGILECFEQGNELLGEYNSELVSVHDPDEYLDAAKNEAERNARYQDILNAYQALKTLKDQGKAKAIGIGAKNWRVIQEISRDVALDWVMIANSMTVHSHPTELLEFMAELEQKGVAIINSAVFNGGFLVGGNHYNYKEVDAASAEGHDLLKWREHFNSICEKHSLKPAEVCVQFGINAPGVVSIALSTSDAAKVERNVRLADKTIPEAFWTDLLGSDLDNYLRKNLKA